MSAIKERLLYCIIGTIFCAVIALWFVFRTTWHLAILFAMAAIILFLFTIRLSEHYQSAKLIFENPILNVGIASVSKMGNDATSNTVHVVVSGFGILIDEKPYKFGHGSVSLTETTIDRESITLSFGDEENVFSVRLLHGIADKAEVDKLANRLHYETGIVAHVSGW